MNKSGTTTAFAGAMMSKSTSGVRNGPGHKNVVNRAKPAGRPKGPTGPIKGMDRGGV